MREGIITSRAERDEDAGRTRDPHRQTRERAKSPSPPGFLRGLSSHGSEAISSSRRRTQTPVMSRR